MSLTIHGDPSFRAALLKTESHFPKSNGNLPEDGLTDDRKNKFWRMDRTLKGEAEFLVPGNGGGEDIVINAFDAGAREFDERDVLERRVLLLHP